jgi:hypothetical protein
MCLIFFVEPSMWRKWLIRAFFALLGALPLASIDLSASDYGTTGLVDTPTARMQDDGVLTVTSAWDGLHKSHMFTYQLTPWLEGTFRYTGFNDFFYWDRNYELKARLWEEEYLLPQVAVGIRDVVGTGVFGSEYVVASKTMGAFDVSMGMGWGRLAGEGDFRNPLISVSPRFRSRSNDFGQGGELAYNSFFSGSRVGVFGGVDYSLSTWPLTLMLEYNPDTYRVPIAGNPGYEPSSKWSYGIEWQALPSLSIALTHQHKDFIGISFRTRVNTSVIPEKQNPPVFVSSRDLPQNQLPPQINKAKWYDRLLFDVERSGLILVSARIDKTGAQAELVVGNKGYAIWADAIAQHLALADLHLPPSVQTIHFVVEDGGHRVTTLALPRPSRIGFKRDMASRNTSLLPGRDIEKPDYRTGFNTGKIHFIGDLNNRLQLFDPDDPARYQLYLDLGAEYSLSAYWAIRAKYGFDITNTFDESNRKESDSVLPKVRSDIVKYLTEGSTGLDMLMVEGRSSLGPELHYRAFAGVLEEMYSGVGGELLYMPHQSRLAVGVSVAYARQRDYSKTLQHLDYSAVTGFVSAYWATPYYNYDAAIHIGQYLAEDRGATLELRRTFENGWQLGAWATFTNVSSEDFGEGSFDKGFYFKIPLDGLFGARSRNSFSTRMRPIQRDGGQRLENHSANLFWDLREARFDSFSKHIPRIYQ